MYGSTVLVGDMSTVETIFAMYRCSETSLSACTVSTVLVGDMSTVARARLVDSLMQSELRSEFFV